MKGKILILALLISSTNYSQLQNWDVNGNPVSVYRMDKNEKTKLFTDDFDLAAKLLLIEGSLENNKKQVEKRSTIYDSTRLTSLKKDISKVSSYPNSKYYLNEVNFYLSIIKEDDVIGVNTDILRNRGVEHYKDKRYSKSIPIFSRYLDSIPNDSTIMAYRSIAMSKMLYSAVMNKNRFQANENYNYDTSFVTKSLLNDVSDDCNYLINEQGKLNFLFWEGTMYFNAGKIYGNYKIEYWEKAKTRLEKHLLSSPTDKNATEYIKQINAFFK